MKIIREMKCQTCGTYNPENAQFWGVFGSNLSFGEVTGGPKLSMVGFGEAVSRGLLEIGNEMRVQIQRCHNSRVT